MKPTVGLTGGIASGKSTVACMFAAHGIPIVDADQLARDVVAPGTPGLSAIVEAFGDAFLQEDGTLDRAKMGELVFGDPEARKKLNAIVHPRIAAAGMSAMQALQDDPAPYLMYEAALLVENRLHRAFGALVVVTVDEDTQRERLMERDVFSQDQAQARIDSQMPLAEKVEVANYTVSNMGALAATQSRVDEIHAALIERFGKQS